MSFKNFLDLRSRPQIQIIERVVFKKRPIYAEILSVLAVIAVVSTVVWGISNADVILPAEKPVPVKNFSISGIVSDVTEVSISIDSTNTPAGYEVGSFTFNLDSVKKIESLKYQQLKISDIKVGDKIVLQGLDSDGVIQIRRIVSFVSFVDMPIPEIATSTISIATSTATTSEIVTSTSSVEIASTTDELISTTTTTENSSSTETTSQGVVESIVETVKNTVGDVVDGVQTTVSNIIEAVTSPEPATPDAPSEAQSSVSSDTPVESSASVDSSSSQTETTTSPTE